MDSPEDEETAIKAVAYDSPSPQKSPISKYISTLPPIGELRYQRRLFESSFSTPVSVFGSNPLDLQGETSFLKRENIAGSSTNAHGKFDAKQLQYCSPYESADGYGSLEVDGGKQHGGICLQSTNNVPQQVPSCFRASEVRTEEIDVDSNGCFVGVGQPVLPGFSQKPFLPLSLNLFDVCSDRMLEFSSKNTCNPILSNEILENRVGQVDSVTFQKIKSDEYAKEASLHQHGIRRHLQFVDTLDSLDAFKFHTSATPRIAIQSLIEPKQVSNSSQENHMPMRSNYFLKETNEPLMSTGQEIIDLVDNDNQRSEAVAVGVHLPEITVSPWESQQASSFNQQTVPRDVYMPVKQFGEMVEEQSQSQESFKWKRKRETHTDEKEGCKRCNCKRSKCLKLYCECFASGVYCADSCACESCFNKPDFEDSVSDAREQIESRNPLAFAPIVVEQTNDSPNVVDDGSLITSSSVRHKRGCKCKRSKCLKKYCECYRAKVGCSDGCHCESCDNSFGKKSETVWKNLSHGGTEDQLSSTWEKLMDMNHLTPLPSSVGDCPNLESTQSQNQLLPDQHQHQWCSPTTLTSSRGYADILMDSSNPTNTSSNQHLQSFNSSSEAIQTGTSEWNDNTNWKTFCISDRK